MPKAAGTPVHPIPPVCSLCVVLVPAPGPTGSYPGRPQTFQLVQRAEAGPQSCRAHPISSGPEVCCPPRRPTGMGGEESPRSAAHAEGGQQGPELEGPVGTPLWGADSWPGPAALWAALLGWRASRGPLGWGAAERQHPGVGWGSQRQAVLCPSAPALVGGPAGQAGPASWAGSLRVKASAPSRSPSGPFFHLTPETQRLLAEGPGTASGPGAGVGVGVVGAPPSLSTPGGGCGGAPEPG